MYGKFFASTFTGSMMASGADVFSVWAYVIANAYKSHVELNPKLLAAMIGATPERMQAAIDTLCSPDPDSRSKECEGRRLVKEGEYQYFVPNHEKYRAIRDEEERREYNRLAKRKEREKAKEKAPIKGPCLYFMRDARGFIKIGFSENPIQRIKASGMKDTGGRGPFELIGMCSGTLEDEKALHKRFSEFNVEGEWFESDNRLIEYIKYVSIDVSMTCQ